MKANDLRGMTLEDLDKELLTLRREQFNLRMQAATGEAADTSEPKRVRVDAINSTAIRVMWNPPLSSERNGIIRGYQLYYQPIRNARPAGDMTMKDYENGNQTEAVIGGLEPETEYQFTVSAYTRKGDGTRSRPKSATTKGASELLMRVTQLLSVVLACPDHTLRHTIHISRRPEFRVVRAPCAHNA